MKPKMRTREWLVEARRFAEMSQNELIELAGFGSKSNMAISNYESGRRNPSPRTWAKIEDALRPRAPIMFVDEDDLIADVNACMRREEEDSLCRLTYSPGKLGFVITGVSSAQKEAPSSPYITVSFKEAMGLLEAQKKMAGSYFTLDVAPPDAGNSDKGSRVRELRIALGLSQKEVASLLGAHQYQISGIENGRREQTELVERCHELLERLASERGLQRGETDETELAE